ncbi:FtsX-like permease family protein [Candidatus Contubernalis alkaliaceticus]|uniref:FtsX-like permease family protein n=1 Tax=Candidatus Contubernalis alkaliaceticus TaxID=338645 RepID=UPI001F4C14FB|nr:ABC transporter permease [Candidatus Contubernalis alkalaceticus]UNC92032.1 ABC transporter permease [Candidatus Contubernalis alkalaceticus]
MTFRQLVLKNLRTNLRRYLAYFLCVLFSMTIFFLFAAIWFVPDFTEQTSAGMRQIILIGWIITGLFSLFFISYAHNQFSKARAREFGILLSYGLLQRDIKKMVILENIIIYLAALLSAFLGGAVFSRLFFLIITSLLRIENIHFALTVQSFLLTAVSFVPVLAAVALLTMMKTANTTVMSLLKEAGHPELQQSGNLSLAMLGIVIIILTVGSLFFYTSDPANTLSMQRVIIAAFVLCLTGLYLFIHNFGSIYYAMIKSRPNSYYANIINLAEVAHRFGQNRTVTFVVCLLSVGVVMFTSLSYTLFTQTYWVVEQEQLYDVMIKEFSTLNHHMGSDYEDILNSSDASVINSGSLDVIYLQAPQIINDLWRPNKWVPITPLTQYNSVFNSDYQLADGAAITVVYNRLENDREFFIEEIHLQDGNVSIILHQEQTIYKKIFDRYAFGQPVIIVISDSDFAQFAHQAEEVNKGALHLYKYDDWTKSGLAVQKLVDEQQVTLSVLSATYPEEIAVITSRHPHAFNPVSKYMRYDHNKQVGGFALFIMGFISLLFVVAICILVYFKIFSDHQDDKEKIALLSTVGITSFQIKRYLYGKLKLIMTIPIFLGSLLAIAFSLALNLGNVVEMEISNMVILSNTLIITIVYWLFVQLFYHWLKFDYYRSLN